MAAKGTDRLQLHLQLRKGLLGPEALPDTFLVLPQPAPEEPPDLVEIAEDRSGHAALNELLLQVPAKPLVLPPRILETLVMAHAGPADRLSKLPVTVYCVTEQVLVVKTFSAKVLESFSAL